MKILQREIECQMYSLHPHDALHRLHSDCSIPGTYADVPTMWRIRLANVAQTMLSFPCAHWLCQTIPVREHQSNTWKTIPGNLWISRFIFGDRWWRDEYESYLSEDVFGVGVVEWNGIAALQQYVCRCIYRWILLQFVTSAFAIISEQWQWNGVGARAHVDCLFGHFQYLLQILFRNFLKIRKITEKRGRANSG